MRYIALLFFLISAQYGHAQWLRKGEVQRTGANTRIFPAEVKSEETLSISEQTYFTAIAFRFKGDPQGAYLRGGGIEAAVSIDEHYQGEGRSSNLIVFDQPVNKYDFYTGGLNGKVDVILINAGKIRLSEQQLRTNEETGPCEAPAEVDQSVWREGLPTPQYDRSFTTTENMIVHHSATSNELTDYTNIVRNIYLYHTQSHGWSDIGYNYLIAPDGTVFKGRDPGQGEQDLVLGAHFCGRNSTTMGVCLLGTFTSVAPTDRALEALTKLLAWKADKDDLDPVGIDPHPLNASLPVIAGHRDGCSTACPGDMAYAMLPEIRMATADTIQACHESGEDSEFALYPNPARLHFKVKLAEGNIHEFKLYDMQGHFSTIYPIGKSGNVLTFSTYGLPSGIYVLHYHSSSQLIKRRLVIYQP